MESVPLSWMNDIDIYEYLDLNVHTVTFDDKRWKVDVLLDNVEKLFTGIKCTKCNENDASYVHLENKTYYCEKDSAYIDKLDKDVKGFERMKDELKEVIIKIEKYNLIVQERTHLLIQEKLVLVKEECDFNDKVKVLERNLEFFRNDLQNLRNKWNLDLFLKLPSSFKKIKEIVNDIIKIAAELLLELELERLIRNVKEGCEHDLSHLDPKEAVKSHGDTPHPKSGLYHKPCEIVNPQYISAVMLK